MHDFTNLKRLFAYTPRPAQAKYLHSKYAGNRGDVFKHLLLSEAVRHVYRRIPRGEVFRYRETHAGPGLSPLQTGGRWLDGLGALYDDVQLQARWPVLAHMVQLGKQQQCYYGSWVWAAQVLRQEEGKGALELWEWNADVVSVMQDVARQLLPDQVVDIQQGDGFAAVLGATRFNPHFTMIDPPYTLEPDKPEDWTQTILAIRHLRNVGATFAVWYPIFSRNRAQRFVEAAGLTGIELVWGDLNARPGRHHSRGCGMLFSEDLAGVIDADGRRLGLLAHAMNARFGWRVPVSA